MTRLDEMIRSAEPSTPLQFRAAAYGPKGERDFLRDLIAIANASVKGPRLIVVGVDTSTPGKRIFDGVNEGEFKRQPSYVDLARQFIEPPIDFSFQPVVFNETRLGVFHINDCQDRPYMMRADHSATLRRGDAWIRVNDEVFRMGRSQLQALFHANFKDSIAPERIEIGFSGEMLRKILVLPTADLSQLPSVKAAGKIQQLMDVKANSKGTGQTTTIARLTHARLFGSENPYEDQSAETLAGELDDITQRHRVDDFKFLYGQNGCDVQLSIFNQSETSIQDAAFTLVLPELPGLHVAPRPIEDGAVAGYPSLTRKDGAIIVTRHLGEVPPGAPVPVFATPLKVCVDQGLLNQRVKVAFTLFGRNLRLPVRGQLGIDFKDQLEALVA